MGRSLRERRKADDRRIAANKQYVASLNAAMKDRTLRSMWASVPPMFFNASEVSEPSSAIDEPEEVVSPIRATLIDYPEAATILGISVGALCMRVSRCQVASAAVVKTGRRTQFHREKLLASLEKRVRR